MSLAQGYSVARKRATISASLLALTVRIGISFLLFYHGRFSASMYQIDLTCPNPIAVLYPTPQ